MENKKKYFGLVIFLNLLLFLSLFISMGIGRYHFDLSKFIQSIQNPASMSGVEKSVLFDIRIPRIFMSLTVGMGLSLAGTSYQAVLRNPLASPDILGTSSAAAFGAAAGILLFPNSFILTCILSFVCGILSIFLVFGISRIKRDGDILTIVLSGMIVSSIFMSLIAVIKFIADTEDTLPAITFWLMGSFSAVNLKQALLIIPPFQICFFILYLLRWKLNILSLGDDEAIVAGIHPQRLRMILLMISSIIVALSVTVSGIVGWVGLMIPHLTRTIVGYNHGKVIPISGLLGGIFLLFVDNLARSLGFAEIPIGMLTALIGAPVFLLLFLKGNPQ